MNARHVIIPWIPISIILILSAFLRLYSISGYMTFLGDEGRDVLVVKRIIVDHKFTLLGPTASVGGFFLGPIYYYFMLPFLWAWKLDPTGPAVMVALFGIATVYLVYRITKDFFGEWPGIVASSLYAVSPITIAYSRSSWNPNLVPFFSLLLIWVLWKFTMRKNWKHMTIAGILLGIGLQLHYLFLFLIPVVLLWTLMHENRHNLLWYLLYGSTGFVIGYAPFLIFELRHGFPNTQTLIRFILEGKDTGFVWGTYLKTIDDIILRVFGRLVFRLPQNEIWVNYPPWLMVLWTGGIRVVGYGTVLLLCIGSFTKSIRFPVIRRVNEIRRAYDRGNASPLSSRMLFFWFIAVLLLFGFYKKAIYDYYFGIVFAYPFICIGMIFSRLRSIFLNQAVPLFLWIGLLTFNLIGMPFRYPPNNQLAQAKSIASAVLEKTNGLPFNFALITNANSDHAYRYFFEIWGNPPITIENRENDPERKTVTDQLIVICELYECKPLGHPLWEVAGFGRAEIVDEWNVPFVRIFKLMHYTGGTT